MPTPFGQLLGRLAVVAAALATLAGVALAQTPQRAYLPQVRSGPIPTVIAVRDMVTILAVGPREASNPAASQQVLLRNETQYPIYLGGWSVRNALWPEVEPYVFPPYELAAGRTLALISGPVEPRPVDGLFGWGLDAPIWRTGDVAELYAPDGTRVSWLVVPVLPPPPSASPVPTATPVPPSAEINDVVLRDPAFPNESDEYVQIRNAGDSDVNIGGWRLINASRPGQTPAFVFPNYTLEVDVTIAVFSAVGVDELEVGDFYWDRTNDRPMRVP